MTCATTERKPVILLGAGGHAKVVLSLLNAAGWTVLGVTDPGLASDGMSLWRGLPVLGGDEVLMKFKGRDIGLVNGLGQLAGSNKRYRLFEFLKEEGFDFPVLIHPQACVDASVRLGEGVQIMAGVIIQADTVIGMGSIVNTAACIDHDCVIGAHVHIAPGATLCGNVHAHDGAFIASGAVVIQGVVIGENAIVGAGAVLTRNLTAEQTIIGPPMRKK